MSACAADPPTLPGGDGGSTAAADEGTADGGGPGGGTVSGPPGSGDAAADGTGTGTAPTGGSDGGPGPVGEEHTYRINSMRLVDPHFFYPKLGDLTGLFNDQLALWITNDTDDDGNLEAGLVLRFRPLDQADGATGQFEYWNAACPQPNFDTCEPRDATMLYVTTYESQAAGPCLLVQADDLNPDYETPKGPTDHCFVSAPFNVDITTSDLTFPFDGAEVSAQYVGDPAGNLVSGLLRGFITVDAASAAESTFPVLGSVSLSDVLTSGDRDVGPNGEEGWWMYLEFTAITVEWTG